MSQDPGRWPVFGRRIALLRVAGFEVRVDASWGVLALLVTWSLAAGLFPSLVPGAPPWLYWLMGLVGLAGLVCSIVLHELSHALVARHFGMSIHGITLFLFGGVAEMGEEPPHARAEFLMAGAGPLTSSLIAVLLFVALALMPDGAPGPFAAVLLYLAYLNAVLALFNLLPAFPLDGGRMLRAALWGWHGDLARATGVAAGAGSAFGLLLAGVGVFLLFSGNPIGGLWWILIGFFLRQAALASHARQALHSRLHGRPVHRYMRPSPLAISPDLPLDRLADDFVQHYPRQVFPVVHGGTLVGCVAGQDLSAVERDQWGRHKVAEVVHACPAVGTVAPDTDAAEALRRLAEQGQQRLLVVEGGQLVGVLTQRDLLRDVSVRIAGG